MGEDPRHQLGRRGEDAAAVYLCDAGWVVRERNWRCRGGEIDLIVERGDTIAFVEVRTRSSMSGGLRRVSPEETVDHRKRQRLSRTAQRWLVENPSPRRVLRFDVIGVTVDVADQMDIRHYPNAFGVC